MIDLAAQTENVLTQYRPLRRHFRDAADAALSGAAPRGHLSRTQWRQFTGSVVTAANSTPYSAPDTSLLATVPQPTRAQIF